MKRIGWVYRAAWAALAVAGSAAAQHGAITNSPAPPIIAVSPPAAPPIIVAPATPPEPPMPPAAHLIRPPEPRGTIASLVNPLDYPASALAARQQGIVRFRLFVGPDGRVAGCAILRSSGSSALDSATCQLIRRRARFTPALDSNGNAAAGTVDDQIAWHLP